MTALKNSETRTLKISPNLVYTIIEAQAGSMSKAFLEYIMNSVDSGSSRVDIDISADGFSITDDGSGFSIINEIKEFFEVFGFEHSDDDHRTYGKFGMGRAQMWSWASTTWRTSEFQMVVDIKNKGLEYDLIKGLEAQDGCIVSGSFYEPLLPSDIKSTSNEIAKLALFCPIPVFINGVQVSKNIKDVKWDVETEDAYIKYDKSNSLSVYNLGIYVREYHASYIGTGGVVVSKKSLQVNFARNDVLLAKCVVWKNLKKYLQVESTKAAKKSTKITDEQRLNLINQLISGDLSYFDACKLKLLRDTRGRYYELGKLGRITSISVSPEEGSLIAEHIHMSKTCFILSPSTLTMFDCETIHEFYDLMKEIAPSHVGYNLKPVDFETFKDTFSGDHKPLSDKELSPTELLCLRALRETQYRLIQILTRKEWDDTGSRNSTIKKRILQAGVSDVSDGWTDGREYIFINRTLLQAAKSGHAGFLDLAMLLVHEYCHDASDAESHTHSLEFYENFHDIVSGSNSEGFSEFILKSMHSFTAHMRVAGKKISNKLIRLEDLEAQVFNGVKKKA